ncbi:MAG: hypothetical protein U0R68_04500 [Candidatus Nanopelagicales bacterium]
MMVIGFEGWWQCRFATDPDPTDDPRGVSGPTFVVEGEPPFDRKIRFQNPVSPRYPMEKAVGVRVTDVEVDGKPAPRHPLVGSQVDLLDGPEFHQRNLVLVRESFIVFIDPLNLRIGTPGTTPVLRREALWDVTRPELRMKDVFLDEALLATRQNTIAAQSAVVAEATGILDYSGYRAERLKVLKARRSTTKDPTEQVALDRRIVSLEDDQRLSGVMLASTQFLGMQATYTDIALNGTLSVDKEPDLGGHVGRSQPWSLTMWWGGYDVDTMLGYTRGTVSIPFVATPR